jgi:hypothetical protein
MQLIKSVAIGLLIGFLLGLMTCKNCTPNSNNTEAASNTSDTIQKPIPPDTGSIREPVLVLEGGKIPSEPSEPKVLVKYQTVVVKDSLSELELRTLQRHYNDLVKEYEGLYNDYAISRRYTDTTRFVLGRGIVNFEVEKNRAINIQQTFDSLHYTYVKETITIPAQKRMIGYFGVGGFYQIGYPLWYAGGTFKLKFKNDAIIGLNGYINGNGQTIVGAEYAVPIRLGKKR